MHSKPLTELRYRRLSHTAINRAVGGRRTALAFGLALVFSAMLLPGLARQADIPVAKSIPPLLSSGMEVSETQAYRYETLYDGTVTTSLATPILRDDEQLVSTMVEILHAVYAIPSSIDLTVSFEHTEGTNIWRFSHGRYVYWVESLPVVGHHVERFSLRRQRSP